METNPEGVYASYRNFLPAGLTGLILKETMLLQIDTFSQQAYRWPKPLAALGVILVASLSLASLAISSWCSPLLYRHLQAALSLVWLHPWLHSGTLAGTIWVQEMETCCRKRWSRTASGAWFSSTSRVKAGMLLRLGHQLMYWSFLVLPLGFPCCF